ncbi:MAG TPA: hypothetical protein PKN62_01595 [bacterium]|nr:hypothetical protein [bacterium]
MNKKHLLYSGLMVAFLIVSGVAWASIQTVSSQAEVVKKSASKGCGCGSASCGIKAESQNQASCGCNKAQNGEKTDFVDNNSDGICDRAE